ncbi:MAG: hypothetical protein QE509_07900 [Gammaproteobacteria bacterium]|nr:hypothetical protein [Gammaproteobacteria bacterium]
MSASTFIAEGQPANANPYASTEQSVLPDYYTNAAMQILADQQAVSARPTPIYPGPRIADFTTLQQQAFAQTPGAASAYQPYLAQAGRNTADVTQQFMNPYTSQVVDRIGQMGTRALNEQILPGIEGSMIRAGQFGGTRQAELMGRAVREATEGISAQQSQALERGYAQSLGAAQQEQTRQGGLASLAQQLGLRGVDAMQTAGGLQQAQTQRNLDLGVSDFERQFNAPQENINNLIKTLQGVGGAMPKSILKQGYGTEPTKVGPSGLETAASTGITVYALLKELGLFD